MQVAPSLVLIVSDDGQTFRWMPNPERAPHPFVLAAAAVKLNEMVAEMMRPPAEPQGVQPASPADTIALDQLRKRGVNGTGS